MGSHATQEEVDESKKVREGQVMNVPFCEEEEGTQEVGEEEVGWRVGWQVRQVPEGEAQVAQVGSHAVSFQPIP